jgi:hypothetical protein
MVADQHGRRRVVDRRDMKTALELRPVYHRLEDRIRAQGPGVVPLWCEMPGLG